MNQREILMETIKSKVKKDRRNILIAEGWDESCLIAAAKILDEGLIDVILLGNPEELFNKSKKLGINISNAKIVDFKNYKNIDELANKFVEIRKEKGLTYDQALELLKDENYFACLYSLCGYADGFVGSKICSTAAMMKPVLQTLRIKNSLVSEIMVVYFSDLDKVIFSSDSSLNINPSEEDLAKIAVNAAIVVKSFNIIPRVALISFSTKGSGGSDVSVKKILSATEIANKISPDSEFIIDGEYQIDAAVNPGAALRKCPDAKIKGNANTLIFPNLESANVYGHSVLQFSNAELMFSIMSGLQIPVGILGRSTPSEVVVNMIYSVAAQVK